MSSTLDQWRTLAAVIDAGGYARAAERLGRSQSSISYAIAQLQEALGVRLLELQGRRAVLTTNGRELLQRARVLIDGAEALDASAAAIALGGTLEINLAIEPIYPVDRVVRALARFSEQFPHIAIELHEPILSGVTDTLLDGRAQLAVSAGVPAGFLSEAFDAVTFRAVAATDHPLLRKQSLDLEALRSERQIVVRDSGARRRLDAGWLGARDRWTVASLTTSLELVRKGLGFAWLPEHIIAPALEAGDLAVLPLRDGADRTVSVNLIRSPAMGSPPAYAALAEMLRAERLPLPQ